MARAAARYYITADSSGVRKGTREAERDITRMGKAGSAAFTGLKVGALAAGAAIGTTLALGIRTGWQEMLEAQKVTAATTTVLKNLRGETDVTRKQVEELSGSLQDLTGYQDEQIQATQNQLLIMARLNSQELPRATRATLDLSRAFDRDLTSTARVLGKALADPEKGLTALGRIGVKFTEQQREQIKAWTEQGQTARAQALILSEVESRVKGASEAYGKTLPGAIDRARRQWEDFTESAVTAAAENWPEIQRTIQQVIRWIEVNVAPTVREVVATVTEFWEEHEQDIRRVFGLVARTLGRFLDNIRQVVRLVRSILKGDFGEAWEAIQQIVRNALNGVVDIIRTLGPILGRAMLALGEKLKDKLIDGIKAAPGALGNAVKALITRGIPAIVSAAADLGKKIPYAIAAGIGSTGSVVGTALTNLLPDWANPLDAVRRAGGGMIPGVYRGVDDRLALVASGEAVLTPAQQEMIPGGRATLNRIFRATGGITGGRGYADGGWVHPAPGSRRGGGPGQGTHSYSSPPDNWQSDTAYDLMGRDGMPVYAAYAGRISGVRPFSSDPRFWGMAAYLDVPGGQFYYKHLKSLAVKPGDRVTAGQLIGHLGTGVNGGPHLHLGASSRTILERAVNASAAASGYGARGADHDTPDDEARQAPRDGLTVKQFKSGLRVDAAERRAGGGGDMTAIGSITGRHADDQLQERRMQAAGAPESRVLQARRNELVQDIRDIDGRLGQLAGRLRTYVQRRVKLRREALNPRTRPARRAQIRGLIGDLIDLETQIQDAQRTLRSERTDLVRQAMILGYDIADAQATEEQAARDAATDTGAGAAEPVVTNELTAQQRAQINTGILAEEFIRAAFGPGDIGTGGSTAMAAATGGRYVTVNVDAASFAAATATAAGTQGYITVAAVPSGA